MLLYADENFPLAVTEELQRLGHRYSRCTKMAARRIAISTTLLQVSVGAAPVSTARSHCQMPENPALGARTGLPWPALIAAAPKTREKPATRRAEDAGAPRPNQQWLVTRPSADQSRSPVAVGRPAPNEYFPRANVRS